jgi:16S rRNA (uracil1498-N3)-methyltransferase
MNWYSLLSILEVNATVKKNPVIVAVGPEGDFSTNEYDLLKNNGFVSLRLGQQILTTETATAVLLGNIRFIFSKIIS